MFLEYAFGPVSRPAMTRLLPPLELAGRMSRLGTENAFEVLARAKALEAQGKSIIHLEIGEPDFPTPDFIVEAGLQAIQDEANHHYGPAAGVPDVREAVAHHVAATRNVECSPLEVVMVPGSKPVMFYAMLALLEEGDEVILPDPGYPIYESMVSFSGAKPISCPLRSENNFAADPEELLSLITPATRMVILNSPGNPTGAVLPPESLDAIVEGLRNHPRIWLLTDEIYWRLIFDDAVHSSALSNPDIRERTILLDGWSKAYAMTGWRLGFGVMRPDLAEQVSRLMINSTSCTTTFVQRAGVVALEGDQAPIEAMKERFNRRRLHIVKLLNEIPGVTCALPQGAFYVFPDVSSFGLPSGEIAEKALQEAGVACLAGTSFGKAGEGFLRLSYAASLANIEEGIGRLRVILDELR